MGKEEGNKRFIYVSLHCLEVFFFFSGFVLRWGFTVQLCLASNSEIWLELKNVPPGLAVNFPLKTAPLLERWLSNEEHLSILEDCGFSSQHPYGGL